MYFCSLSSLNINECCTLAGLFFYRNTHFHYFVGWYTFRFLESHLHVTNMARIYPSAMFPKIQTTSKINIFDFQENFQQHSWKNLHYL